MSRAKINQETGELMQDALKRLLVRIAQQDRDKRLAAASRLGWNMYGTSTYAAIVEALAVVHDVVDEVAEQGLASMIPAEMLIRIIREKAMGPAVDTEAAQAAAGNSYRGAANAGILEV